MNIKTVAKQLTEAGLKVLNVSSVAEQIEVEQTGSLSDLMATFKRLGIRDASQSGKVWTVFVG